MTIDQSAEPARETAWEPDPKPARTGDGSETLWYAYGILAAAQVGSAPTLPEGVAGGTPRLVVSGGLAAAVSPVPAPDFERERLEENLERFEWLDRTARAHHAVVEALRERGTVLPLRLVTVYRSEERVREVLEEYSASFQDGLARLVGHSEWGVKLYLRPDGSSPATGAEAGAAVAEGAAEAGRREPERPRSGREYLRRRGRQRNAEEDAWRAAARIGERIDGAVRDLVHGARRYPPQDSRLSGRSDQNVLNVAYLVADSGVDEFLAVVRDLTGGHHRVHAEVVGPWAPYSFATEAPA